MQFLNLLLLLPNFVLIKTLKSLAVALQLFELSDILILYFFHQICYHLFEIPSLVLQSFLMELKRHSLIRLQFHLVLKISLNLDLNLMSLQLLLLSSPFSIQLNELLHLHQLILQVPYLPFVHCFQGLDYMQQMVFDACYFILAGLLIFYQLLLVALVLLDVLLLQR